MEPIETYEHANHIVKIYYDEDQEWVDPRQNDGNIGVILCAHRRYKLGDEQITGDDFSTDVECSRCDGTGTIITDLPCDDCERTHPWRECEPCSDCGGDGYVALSIVDYLKQVRGATVVLPLGLIDHSGISMYVGSGSHPHDPEGWDSGQVGVIFDTPQTRAHLTDHSPENIEKELRQEVDIYDQFLRGEVFGYVVENQDGEEIDSCWGMLGNLDEYVKPEANRVAEIS